MCVLASAFNIQMTKAEKPLFSSSEYVGDLTIGNQSVYNISNETFNLTGRLIIKDNALVSIRNAQVHITCLGDQWNWIPELEIMNGPWRIIIILVEGQAKLEVDNATFVFSAPYPLSAAYHFVYLNGSAEVRMNNSRFVYANGGGDNIEATNNSRLYIANTNLTTGYYVSILKSIEPYPISGLVSRGNSNVYVENCSLDGVGFLGNSSVTLLNTNVTDANVYEEYGNSPTIDMTDSRIEGQLWILCPANVHLTNMFVNQLDARVSANVWAERCHFQEVGVGFDAKVFLSQTEAWKVYTYKGGAIYFFFDLPLLGRVMVQTGFIYILSILLILAGAITIVFAYFQRKRKPNKTQAEQKSMNKGFL